MVSCVFLLAQNALPPTANALFKKATRSKFAQEALARDPEILATPDGSSYLAVWRPAVTPRAWLFSIHGSNGYALDDMALWLRGWGGRPVGLVCLQWWKGTGQEDPDYHVPDWIYGAFKPVFAKVGLKPGTGILHGFSRGSTQTFSLMAMDQRQNFGFAIAHSGGYQANYPPNRAIGDGKWGANPLDGTRWVTVAGGLEKHPERDGYPSMRRTAEWLMGQGATVELVIEDDQEGHGALHRNPQNIGKVLDYVLSNVP